MKQDQAHQDQMKHDMGQDQTKRGRREARIRGACHSQTKRGKP